MPPPHVLPAQFVTMCAVQVGVKGVWFWGLSRMFVISLRWGGGGREAIPLSNFILQRLLLCSPFGTM